ncbi:unnamed protein product [Vitrella brassicaformis CCMP3155]|uniref:Uncharacterized protein n=1 Tax=Vitrella brassicaformis (strain CCMP3155) TaxID=1169540 RepID=A0A0G4FM75_VITBC|nr:unnamed protein product [Vitrella brassicaformis CCMP3155]|eukprot:CEM15080.1 unnamed protein product [Vitrella brassicaformis CCMP3155]
MTNEFDRQTAPQQADGVRPAAAEGEGGDRRFFDFTYSEARRDAHRVRELKQLLKSERWVDKKSILISTWRRQDADILTEALTKAGRWEDIFLFWAELKEGRLPPTQPLSSSGLPLSCDGVLALDFSSSLDATHEVPPSAGPSSASAPTTYTASRSAAVPINTAMRVAQRQCPTGTPSALDEALAVLFATQFESRIIFSDHEHQLNRTVVEVFGNGGQSRDARIRIEMTTEEFYPQDLYQG